jgi:SAM-dependent methyltransferase
MAFRTRRAVILVICEFAVASAAATAILFPWDTDPQADESVKTRTYYDKAYATGQKFATGAGVAPLSEKEQFYIDNARKTAVESGVPKVVASFVRKYSLENKKVLEVGAGSGLFQDAVADYTALDISPTAARFFHKPFVEASATSMPFADGTFDALWSIWVLEHIPNPERALLEIRRVVKPGGLLLMAPAFDCSRFNAHGYGVRPYSDFGFKGKLMKATATMVDSGPFRCLYLPQTKILRSIGARLGGGPSSLRFARLNPNYEQYWMADSDAAVSFTAHELYLWFTTRGDRCLNCPSEPRFWFEWPGIRYLIIEVRK